MDTSHEHRIELTRTANANPDVPDALHLKCSCGWAAAAHDDEAADRITREHLATGDPAPAPAAPSPN